MVCYTVPLIAALVHSGMRKKVTSLNKSAHHLWLSMLLAGGAIFGVVDHLWNGELFLIGKNIVSDLLLGVTITTVIFVSWVIVVALDKIKTKKEVKTTQ